MSSRRIDTTKKFTNEEIKEIIKDVKSQRGSFRLQDFDDQISLPKSSESDIFIIQNPHSIISPKTSDRFFLPPIQSSIIKQSRKEKREREKAERREERKTPSPRKRVTISAPDNPQSNLNTKKSYDIRKSQVIQEET